MTLATGYPISVVVCNTMGSCKSFMVASISMNRTTSPLRTRPVQRIHFDPGVVAVMSVLLNTGTCSTADRFNLREGVLV
jgi:hypothetical protein